MILLLYFIKSSCVTFKYNQKYYIIIQTQLSYSGNTPPTHPVYQVVHSGQDQAGVLVSLCIGGLTNTGRLKIKARQFCVVGFGGIPLQCLNSTVHSPYLLVFDW